LGAGLLWWRTRAPSLEQLARRGFTDEVEYVGGKWLAHLEPVDGEPDPADNAPRRFP